MKYRQKGFTLLELMITVVVAIVLMAVAIPSFTNFIQNNRVSGVANELVTALNFARSESVRRSESVELCVYNGNAAAPGCAAVDDWARGWVARVASGPNTGTVLRVWEVETPPGVTLTRIQAGGVTTRVQFNSLGAAESVAAGQRMLWRVQGSNCTAGTALARMVETNRAGRSQVMDGVCV